MNREVHTGKYTFTGDHERLCKCGHTLGVHAATRIKIDGVMFQDCFNYDAAVPGANGDTCECQLFTPKR